MSVALDTISSQPMAWIEEHDAAMTDIPLHVTT